MRCRCNSRNEPAFVRRIFLVQALNQVCAQLHQRIIFLRWLLRIRHIRQQREMQVLDRDSPRYLTSRSSTSLRTCFSSQQKRRHHHQVRHSSGMPSEKSSFGMIFAGSNVVIR